MTGTASRPDTDTIVPIVSVDDHVVEPRDVWTHRMPKRFAASGPRVVRLHGKDLLDVVRSLGKASQLRDAEGLVGEQTTADVWEFEDVRIPLFRTMASAGCDRATVNSAPITYDEIRPGSHDRTHRLSDMDINGVEASMCFPTFPGFAGGVFLRAKNRDLAHQAVRAYNDWMIEDWCGESGGRLVPLCLAPLWDPELAATEVRRNATRGARAVCFSELPARLGLPSIHDAARRWDPFMAACAETETVIAIHIGSSSSMASTSEDAPPAVGSTIVHTNATLALVDWLFSGLFVRFPSLKVLFAEGQVGWMPYILERADTVWTENSGWGGVGDAIDRPPSSYVADHVYGCIFNDRQGIASIDVVGEDNVTVETDYPHSDGTWPDSARILGELTANLDEPVRRKVLRDNARRLFRLGS